MVAYKMYQQYTEHNHIDIEQQIQSLHREHKEMSEDIEELAQVNR